MGGKVVNEVEVGKWINGEWIIGRGWMDINLTVRVNTIVFKL